jgi:hypothetical protein
MTTYIQPNECTNQHHYFPVTVAALGLDIEPMPGTRCACGKTEYTAPDNAEPAYSRDTFDIVKFNFREELAGQVGVHIWKSGLLCTYFAMPVSSLVSPLWEQLRRRAEKAWARAVPPNEPTCSNCGGVIRLNRRSYLGREFCALCGRDYDN